MSIFFSPGPVRQGYGPGGPAQRQAGQRTHRPTPGKEQGCGQGDQRRLHVREGGLGALRGFFEQAPVDRGELPCGALSKIITAVTVPPWELPAVLALVVELVEIVIGVAIG